MQYNQAFCGNPFTDGPRSSYNTPLQSNQSMYPEIVGEGQVTSITLPDGSVQFFFMPTLKWMSANTTPNPMFANNNHSIPQCNNGGSWFIRSILPLFVDENMIGELQIAKNPRKFEFHGLPALPPIVNHKTYFPSSRFPQNVSIPPSQRNEFPRLCNADFSHNLNNFDFGYQVKFHNDAWSSTTDLVYFYPSLRQRDFAYTLPCKDKIVQIDTGPAANTTVCYYELVCTKPCHCSVPAAPAPMSLECLVDPKSTPKNNNMSTDDSCCCKQSNKRGKDKKKNIMWACDSKANIASVDKSITTYADEGCECNPAGGRETQTQPMNKAQLKSKWSAKSYSDDSSSECSCHDVSKKSSNRSEDKPINKAPLKSKRTAKCFSDPMSVECSCDDLSKKPNNRSEDNTKAGPMHKALLMPTWTAKSQSGQSTSVEWCCDDISKKPNKRSKDNTEAKLMHKALLMPKWTAKSQSGQSTSVECSCDDISKKPDKRSEDNADAKPMHKALLMPKWIAKSYSGDSMNTECSCDDASKKPNRRVNDKKYKRWKPNCDCGCHSASSVTGKGPLPHHHGHSIVGISLSSSI